MTPAKPPATIDELVESIRLRIKAQDASAQHIEVESRNGYIVAAWERPSLFDSDSEAFKDYLRALGFHVDEGTVRHYKNGDEETNAAYNGERAFIQVMRTRESI